MKLRIGQVRNLKYVNLIAFNEINQIRIKITKNSYSPIESTSNNHHRKLNSVSNYDLLDIFLIYY